MTRTVWPPHICRPSNNPRYTLQGRCDCGRKIWKPPQPWRRDLATEREITKEATRGITDPDHIIDHAETRARTLSGAYVNDHMLVDPIRNRLRETAEELVDARNHLLWWLLQNPGHPRTQRRMWVLGMIVLLYNEMLEED